MRNLLESIRDDHPLHLIVRRRNALVSLQASKCSCPALSLVGNHSAKQRKQENHSSKQQCDLLSELHFNRITQTKSKKWKLTHEQCARRSWRERGSGLDHEKVWCSFASWGTSCTSSSASQGRLRCKALRTVRPLPSGHSAIPSLLSTPTDPACGALRPPQLSWRRSPILTPFSASLSLSLSRFPTVFLFERLIMEAIRVKES